MDYFRLNNGTFVRVIDIKDGSWIIDMKAGRTCALICNSDGLYVPMRDVAYEIDAVEMAIHMLKAMMQMDWIDSDSISSAIEDLMDRFKDELVINVDITLDSMGETFTIAIRDLSPYAVSKIVVWNYPSG